MKKLLTQIRKTMNKIDKNLEVVNDEFTNLQNLVGELEESTFNKEDKDESE